ncbi:hypothetical protein [Brazilian marseillevirus]|uniref:hypothetical protein n=1 Tax=Brazilian marseillevirus TaxID=1813599 RepID=UPI0007821E91|nr:hypothetical protein A3303_gp485 [Brazilian marseillevirus]AMQ10993.1 hypothetical protein [Brazilian marseillevirus]
MGVFPFEFDKLVITLNLEHKIFLYFFWLKKHCVIRDSLLIFQKPLQHFKMSTCWSCKKQFVPKPCFAWVCKECTEKSENEKACKKCGCKPFRLMPNEDICVPCYASWNLSEFL